MAAQRGDHEAEQGVEDMISLSDLNENTILKNVRVRYERNQIYTYIGSILVAVNPYRMFNIYGLDMVKRYESKQIGELPPHLFAVGSASYSKMVKEKENQVLVISGESGAGKTESTKLVMQYLAAVNKSGNNLITEQILEANPLLESFGNAKTIRNDNSSRFGKYIEVFFKDGAIVGARTLEYLLEKSRIVTQAPEERNYHVFYEMLEALSQEEKSKLGLQTAPKYFYLHQGGSSLIPGRDDAENFRKLVSAMDVLSFTHEEQETIRKILAAVLHIGNIYFKSIQVNNHDTVELGSDAEIKWISHLLMLSDDWLKQALTSKITEARGERVASPYNLDQALDARDAMAKAMYSRLFTWLVERINVIICRAEREKTTSLAVLDIFGFEDFNHNSFEQLCINYANETLQYFFNQHIFQLEQKEYTKEKIKWQHIEFKDNQPVIDLIATKPAGILHILDDECNFPQSRDTSFLEKCHFHHIGNPLYEKPRVSDPDFFIMHYAGRIKYSVLHFIEKNKDTLRSDVVELMCESKNKIISQMFVDLRDRQITKTLSKTTGRYVTLKPRTPTVAASFNESLLSLIDTMSRCHPFFVRCIKPNMNKMAMLFEDSVVMAQLKYSGMLETIRIRKSGYPIRLKFPVFIQRYRCLLHGQSIQPSELPSDACAKILSTLGPSFKNQYQIGATKVFMKETFEILLDGEAGNIQHQAALCIQTRTRAFLARNKFLKTRTSVCTIQRMIRMWKTRREFVYIRNGIIKAQAQFRMLLQRRRYLKNREQIHLQLEQQKLMRRRQEAQVKLEREQRERAAIAMANIANLEVPGELAYVYSKLDDWRQIHDGNSIMTVAMDVQMMDMGYRLPVDINSHPFSKFTSVYFKDGRWGVKTEPLRSPLTTVQSEELSYKALSLFKLILRFMKENNTSEKREKLLADYIVQMGLQNEGVRDELLCQLANQTWQNQNLEEGERLWRLFAACLCCFMPSSTLFKYLLKYVSDVAINGYKWLCQHKILQSANLNPQLSRTYPPCFLEWQAIRRKANMALDVKFPDDVNKIGHVESWTSGELFASHLLKQRGIKESTQGWTVILKEDSEYYELMGYDYVLDLISEMEIAPGFPTCKAYFLVSADRSQERIHHKRRYEGPHNAEQERILVLVHPLPEMLKRTVPVSGPSQASGAAAKRGAGDDGLGFSTTSVLNQRPTEILTGQLSETRINQRYNQRRPAQATNGVANGHSNGNAMNGDEDDELGLSHIRINGRYFPDDFNNELSPSNLNKRYTKKSAAMVASKKVSAMAASRKVSAVQSQINKKQSSGAVSVPSNADVRSVSSEQSDLSHWLEDVFNDALNDSDDGLSDGRSLHTRIKGGGKGLPGVQSQQASVPFNLNLTSPNNALVPPLISPAFQFSPQLTPALASNDVLQQLANQQLQQQAALQQAALQQAAQQAALQQAAQQATLQQQAAQQVALQQQAAVQQQAALQALLLDQQRQQQQSLLQAALQQQQQQQQQQTLLQAALQQQQQQQQQQRQQQNLVANQVAVQQVASLQAALQQTELENKLLKQSIERENLKKQLNQIQPPAPAAGGFASSANISPDASYSSGIIMPPGVQISPRESSEFGRTVSREGPAVMPKHVQSMKSNFESQAGMAQSDFRSDVIVGTAKTNRMVSFSTTATAHQSNSDGSVASSPTSAAVATSLFGQGAKLPVVSSFSSRQQYSPPSSVASDNVYVDGFTPVPHLHSAAPPPPAPRLRSQLEPPPSMPPSISHNIPAPPPPPPPSTIPHGLEIDKEKGTFTIRDRSGRARTVRIGKVVWPPPSEEKTRQEVQVGKLEIDEKVAQGIENRITGKKKWQKPVAPMPEINDRPKSILKKNEDGFPTRRAKSLAETSHVQTLALLEKKLGGGASTQTDAKPASESIGVMTTNTLKRAAGVGLIQDSIYETTIMRDEPPPVPTAPVPKLKVKKREIKEVQEQFETIIRPDRGAEEMFDEIIETEVQQKPLIDFASFERAITELYPQNKKFFLMYHNVPWTLHLRKEVFWPSERLDNPTMLHLIYCQVVQDVFNTACVRITKDQRVKMRSMLEGYGINKNNFLTKELNLKAKKIVIDTAKEWPTYFCRLFPIAGSGHYTGVKYLGVSHTGLRLIIRERNLVDDYLSVTEEIRFEDVIDVILVNNTTIQLNLRTKSLLFYAPRAQQLKDMIDRFCHESEKDNKFVVAIKDYETRESTLLSFKRGDIVKLMDPEMSLEKGWLYGSFNGVVGLFPEEYVRPLARHEVETSSAKPRLYESSQLQRPFSKDGHGPDDNSETSLATGVNDGRMSMMEFARLHFRHSADKYEMLRTEDGSIRGTVKMIENVHSKYTDQNNWSLKDIDDQITWTRSPIQVSLLKLSSSEMNKLALECFIAIMRFMGDYPMGETMTDFDCVMKILRSCHKYPELRDEVYSQLCKQTTNNRSMRGKSKIRGWRLFGLVASYCNCSETLKPYLFKFLEATSSDVNRTFHNSAALCLQNLRKTFRYGGRKNVPLKEEVQAIADGRNCKRFTFYYSGSDTRGGVMQVKSSTVVYDAIVDVCAALNIMDPAEIEEYTLFIRTGDAVAFSNFHRSKGDAVFSKLSRDEYVLDVTAEFVRKKIPYDIIFQRTVWIYPLNHMENEIYVDMMFHQTVIDYMEGLMLVWPNKQPTTQTINDMVKLGALLHRANNLVGVPTLKQLEILVPQTIRNGPILRPQQWLNQIQDRLKEMADCSPMDARALFFETLSKWPLFGSTFFLIQSIPSTSGQCVLAVNKQGISFLHFETHEVILKHPFSEILSTRRYNSDDGRSYLDMKVGNLMVQKILRIETDQGPDISSLIGQYMQVINHSRKQAERL